MSKSSRNLMVALALAAISGCSQDGATIGDDGVYFGELTAESPKLNDGSSYAEHTIALEEGEELSITLQSADFDAYVRVEDLRGDLIGEDDDSAGGNNASLIVIAPTKSIYRIIANTFSSGEYGEYVLAVRRNMPDSLDGVFSGVLPEVDGKSFADNSYPTHDIVAAAGEILDVHLTSGAFDAYVEVQDSNGNVIAEDDDGAGGTNSRLTVPIYDDGTYTVVVKSFGDDGSGAYRLTVRKDSAGELTADGQFERFSGELTASSGRLDDDTPYALHVIDAAAGDELEIGMSSDAFDAYLQLWTDKKEVLAEDDDSGGSLNSKLTFVVPTDGQYIIVANSVGYDATGAYDVTVRRHSLDAELASGKVEILSGALSAMHAAFADGTATASHEILAQAGERLDVLMTAGAFDAYLLVFDSDDRKLSEDDDSGGGTNARLSFIAPTDGTYRIVANSYTQGGEGPYTITLRRD